MLALLVTCITVTLISVTQCQNNYFVDKHVSCNNVYEAAESKQNTTYVEYLGTFDNTDQCINACIAASTLNKRCLTYTYHTSSFRAPYATQCFGRFNDPLWVPYNEKYVNCGQIIWQCQSNMDCSLSGTCSKSGNCSCNTGWTGYRCNELYLLPANKSSGYNHEDNGEHTSSWGGSALYDAGNNKYHMIISEITNHCGMNTWQINSRIINTQSTYGWNSQYERTQILEIPFAHEPDAQRGPNGEYVIYYAHYDYGNKYPPCTECADGSSPPNCQNGVPKTPLYIESMIYSNSLNSLNSTWSWSDPINVLNGNNGILTQDDNLAVVILKNGSVVGMIRHSNTTTCSTVHLVTADNWKVNSSYNARSEYLFPSLSGMCTEDPFLWLDCDGNYHAIFHNMDPTRYIGIDGGHAFSEDGINWIYGGYSFGDYVEFDDGSSLTLHTRERPHLLFDVSNNCQPIALTNGVIYEGGRYGDQSYTFLQPIRH